MAADPTRRVVIAVAALLPLAAVSGCGGVDVLGHPPSPAPDVGLLRAAIAAEELMIARYDAVLRGGGSLTAALDPLLAEHRAHLTQLRSRLIVPAGSASPSPSVRPQGTPSPPAGPAAAVAYLRDAEQGAAAGLLGWLPHAPASLAQLFASISASEATHVPVLDAAAGNLTGQAGG